MTDDARIDEARALIKDASREDFTRRMAWATDETETLPYPEMGEALVEEVADLLEKVAFIEQMHQPKEGARPRWTSTDVEWEPYTICDYDKTPWPCTTYSVLHPDAEGDLE